MSDNPPRAKTLVNLVASLQLDENGVHPGDIRDIVRYARRMQELGLPDNAGGQELPANPPSGTDRSPVTGSHAAKDKSAQQPVPPAPQLPDDLNDDLQDEYDRGLGKD